MKMKIAVAALAAFLMLPLMGTVAYAGGGEDIPEEPPAGVVETEPEPNPFTPPGTGTVVDHATDEDGKEFYTIVTPDGNVFYLVIDRQRGTENVYFLNAVTEEDLLSLAVPSGNADGESAIPGPAEPEPPAPTEPEPDPEPEPEPEKSGGNMGMMVFVAFVVLAGGGAGYYFKIYRPKREQAAASEDYDEYGFEDGEPEESPGGYDDWEDAEPEDDAPPWVEDEDESTEYGEDGADVDSGDDEA